ncbi:MAG: hypothetical protein NTX29_14380 [Actinobacteria bacterium]|nr:hypothetical protein [Actinomycetota bacterium]
MDSSRKSEVTKGVVLPLVVLVIVFALGVGTDQHAVFVALMAAVPMLAAVFAPMGLVVVVSAVTLVGALALMLVPGDSPASDSLGDR